MLSVDAPGVLANDSDADGDSLSATVVSGPSHGTVSLDSNGSFTYVPDSGYEGDDSFVYAASDGSLSSNATVTIAVGHIPVAVDDSYAVAVNGTLTKSASQGVLQND